MLQLRISDCQSCKTYREVYCWERSELLFTPFSVTRFAMHRIYANRINSRGISWVFCDLRSQKTPRGILPAPLFTIICIRLILPHLYIIFIFCRFFFLIINANTYTIQYLPITYKTSKMLSIFWRIYVLFWLFDKI